MRALTEHTKTTTTIQQDSALISTAVEHSNTDMVMYLMKESNPERRNSDATPFMMALQEGNTDILRVLMCDQGNIERKDNEGKNVFHYALASRKPVEATKFVKDNMKKDTLVVPSMNMEVKKLLTSQDCSSSKDTPLHVLAKSNLDLETIEKLFIELEIVLGDLTAKNASKETPLHVAARHDMRTFEEAVLSLGEGDPKMEQLLIAKDKDSNTPLHLAIQKKRSDNAHSPLLKFLKRTRDPVKYFSIENSFGGTPFSGAVATGDYATVKEMLKDLTTSERINLVSLQDRNNISLLHLAAEKGFVLTFKLLLENGADIKMRGPDQKTALEWAIEKDQREVIESIIMCDHWKEAFKLSCSTNLLLDTPLLDTPLRMLIRQYPDLAEKVLNNCCERETMWVEGRTPLDMIKINFDFIEDTNNYTFDHKEDQFVLIDREVTDDLERHHVDTNNHPMIIMANEQKAYLLQHPVCLVITERKWEMYGLKAYRLLVGVYLVFLAALNVFILSSASPIDSPDKFNCTEFFGTIEKNATGNAAQFEEEPKTKEFLNQLFRTIVLVLIVAKVVFFFWYGEFSVLWIQVKRIKWRQAKLPFFFCFELLIYSLAFFLASHDFIWDPSCLQHQVGAVTITLAWINLLLHLRLMDRVGIYIVIFRDIILTFLAASSVFIILLTGFAFGFHILLSHRQEFQTPYDAFLKTTIMMSGKSTSTKSMKYDDTCDVHNNHNEAGHLCKIFNGVSLKGIIHLRITLALNKEKGDLNPI